MAFFWCSQALIVSAVSDLPSWSEDEIVLLEKGEIVPGQALLTRSGVPSEYLLDPWGEEREVTEPVFETDSVESQEIQPAPELPDPEPLPDGRVDLTQGVLMRYFEERPNDFLIDVQQVLSRQEWRDVNFALERHREVSPLPVYMYIFGKEQKVPEAFWPALVFEELFAGSGEPVVIAYYHFGAPERSRVFLGGGLLNGVENWKKKEVAANSRMKARDKSAPLSQLEDFIGQVSMRLYWIEEELQQKERQRIAAEEERVEAYLEKTPGFLDYLEDWLPFMEGLLPKVAVVGGILSGVGFSWIMWLRKRKFWFPEVDSDIRLGGENGAGFGGVLSFKDPQIPPSDQREQFENLL